MEYLQLTLKNNIKVTIHSRLVWKFFRFIEKLRLVFFLILNEFELTQFSMCCNFVVNFVQQLVFSVLIVIITKILNLAASCINFLVIRFWSLRLFWFKTSQPCNSIIYFHQTSYKWLPLSSINLHSSVLLNRRHSVELKRLG